MYKPAFGFLTDYFRNEYIYANLTKYHFNDKSVMSLNYQHNNTNTLYFWQLYSILGEERIHHFIENFYQKIFSDVHDIHFKNTFIRLGNIDYHIFGQQSFWLDVMGGGKKYAGGEFRLKRHHDLAKDIMNTKGALIWLNHMKNTLNNQLIDLTDDCRVKRCIIDFIFFFIRKYENQYNFTLLSKL